MLAFLLIPVFVTLALVLRLPVFAAQFALPFHEACVASAPNSGQNLVYQAMVCGTSIGASPLRTPWAKTGLLHLLVVSGSHLIFLEMSFRWLLNRFPRFASPVIFALLLLFTLANRCQAPVLRALVALCFTRLDEKFHLRWSPVHRLTLSGLVACAFCSDQIAALSLVLSWTASLAVSGFRNEDSPWLTHFKVYALLAPALLPLSLPHPLSIACNLLLGPFLGGVLFPASLACFFVPALTPYVDLLWRGTEWTVSQVASALPQGLSRTPLPLAALILYLFCLTLAAYQMQPARKLREATA